MGSIEPSKKASGSLDVLIIGAGLAGLTAALECHRKGMSVRVLERSPTLNTAGDMFFLGLSATRWMSHWPEIHAEFERISLHNAWMETFKHSGERLVLVMKVEDRIRVPGTHSNPNVQPGSFQMRPLLYQMLLTQVGKGGIKVEFGQKIVSYYEDAEAGKGGVVVGVEGGTEKREADLVIAADGVGSKSQELLGGQVRAISSGRAIWLAVFPVEHLDANPKVKEFFSMVDGKDPAVRAWLGLGQYALALTRPDVVVWVLNHDSTGSERESWNKTIEATEVLEGMEAIPGPNKWTPVFKELVALTPPRTIINFELLWRNPQPSWTSPGARVVQIGDSANSFLPASGDGATQAIEDAVSLATCLQNGKENIEEAVRAHIRLRFIRTSCAQKMGFANAELLQEAKFDKVKMDPRKAGPVARKWLYNHDPESYTEENYAKVVLSMQNNVPWENDENIPLSFPAGYKFEKWSIEQIMEDKRNGIEPEVEAGDWS